MDEGNDAQFMYLLNVVNVGALAQARPGVAPFRRQHVETNSTEKKWQLGENFFGVQF